MNVDKLEKQIREKYKNVLETFENGSPQFDLMSTTVDEAFELKLVVIKKSERGNGWGGKILRDLTDFADKNNAIIVLSPSEIKTSKLIKWYKEFDFLENKGRSKDFRFMSRMIRYPHGLTRSKWIDSKQTASSQVIKSNELPEDMKILLEDFIEGELPESFEIKELNPLDLPPVDLSKSDRGEEHALDMDLTKTPPLVVAHGYLVDGQHRLWKMQRDGIKSAPYIDISHFMQPEYARSVQIIKVTAGIATEVHKFSYSGGEVFYIPTERGELPEEVDSANPIYVVRIDVKDKGQGNGTNLMKKFIGKMKQKGVDAILLDVDYDPEYYDEKMNAVDGQKRLRSFYERLGFKPNTRMYDDGNSMYMSLSGLSPEHMREIAREYESQWTTDESAADVDDLDFTFEKYNLANLKHVGTLRKFLESEYKMWMEQFGEGDADDRLMFFMEEYPFDEQAQKDEPLIIVEKDGKGYVWDGTHRTSGLLENNIFDAWAIVGRPKQATSWFDPITKYNLIEYGANEFSPEQLKEFDKKPTISSRHLNNLCPVCKGRSKCRCMQKSHDIEFVDGKVPETNDVCYECKESTTESRQRSGNKLNLKQALEIRENQYRSRDGQHDYQPEEIDARILELQSNKDEREMKRLEKAAEEMPDDYYDQKYATAESFKGFDFQLITMNMINDDNNYARCTCPNGKHNLRYCDPADAILATKNGKDVGYLAVEKEGNQLFPLMVWVEPEYRRQGLASSLYNYAEKYFGKKIMPGNPTREGLEFRNNRKASSDLSDIQDSYRYLMGNHPVEDNSNKRPYNGCPITMANRELKFKLTTIPGQRKAMIDLLEKLSDEGKVEIGRVFKSNANGESILEVHIINAEDKAYDEIMKYLNLYKHMGDKYEMEFDKVVQKEKAAASNSKFDKALQKVQDSYKTGVYTGYLDPTKYEKELREELAPLTGKPIYRAVRLDHENQLNPKEIGIYWTWDKGKAVTYWGHEGNTIITLESEATDDIIDWESTIEQWMKPQYNGECEVRLKPKSQVEVKNVWVNKIKKEKKFKAVALQDTSVDDAATMLGFRNEDPDVVDLVAKVEDSTVKEFMPEDLKKIYRLHGETFFDHSERDPISLDEALDVLHGTDCPYVIQKDNKYYALDGQHRINTAILCGSPLDIKILNDKDLQFYTYGYKIPEIKAEIPTETGT